MNNEEIEKLKTEIKVLNKRLSIIEHHEARRSFFKKLKIILDVIILCAIGYALWYGYNYVTEYIPNQINETIQNLNPFKK